MYWQDDQPCSEIMVIARSIYDNKYHYRMHLTKYSISDCVSMGHYMNVPLTMHAGYEYGGLGNARNSIQSSVTSSIHGGENPSTLSRL